MMTILTLVISIFVIGLLLSYFKFGLIPSISDNYYYLEDLKKGLGIIFTAWCWIIASLITPISFEVLKEFDYQFLGLFTGGGLMLVGAAPRFKTTEKVIHCVGAYTCALSAVLTCILLGYLIAIIPILIICVEIFRNTKEKDTVFWLEVCAFLSYFLVMFLSL